MPEAVYDNSLIVTLNSETQKTFALSDFDEALFADVKTVSKLKTESGFVSYRNKLNFHQYEYISYK